MASAYHQEGLDRDAEFNKITPDPVLPALGGTGNWPDAHWGYSGVAAVIASPVNVIPGSESQTDRVFGAPGNTIRRSMLYRTIYAAQKGNK
jgi:hypothetical protein